MLGISLSGPTVNEIDDGPAKILCCSEPSSGSGPTGIEVPLGTREKQIFSLQARQISEEFREAFQGVTTGGYDLVEVCCPWDSPLSEAVIQAGGRAFRMGLQNGYDLSTKAGLAKASTMIRRLRPRYIHCSPPCNPWSSLRNGASTVEQHQKLADDKAQGRAILKNCLKLIQLQRQELGGQSGFGKHVGHDAGGEHPLTASSWKEPSMRKMVKICGGEKFRCDGCRFGTQNDQGEPLQKPWGWFSSHDGIRRALNKTCLHQPGEHAKMTSKDKPASAVYPDRLCKAFARALMSSFTKEKLFQAAAYSAESCMANASSSEPGHLEHAEAGPVVETNRSEGGQAGTETDEASQPVDEEIEGPIETWEPDQIIKKIRTIHANLGHPSNQVLCRMLKDAKASPKVLELAAKFECRHCQQRGHASPHKTSQVPEPKQKWDVVSVDTWWWHSPHKDETGNPVEHVLGISWLDEASDFHVASIVRTGKKTQKVLSAKEFRESFSQTWLKWLPRPKIMRFDDEGAFRDQSNIEWLEGQMIRISVIAGEAAWQVGKHSRQLEVLKENMSLLALEVGPEVSATELLNLSLSAKNEMHSVYSPNQWCFRQDKGRLDSYLQHGLHVPTQDLRHRSETFEESLQRANKARETFLRADSRRRILRASRGRARKDQAFQSGQLVYFYRKGRAPGRWDAGWHGPARVLASEKHGSSERNQTAGSIVWIVHGTVLYRCAPEQLRSVTHDVEDVSVELHGREAPWRVIERAGNQANYRDISKDLEHEPLDSELHDVEPRGSTSQHSVPPYRVFGKRPDPPHGRLEDSDRLQEPGTASSAGPRGGSSEAQQEDRVRDGSSGSARPELGDPRLSGGQRREILRQNMSDGVRGGSQVRGVALEPSRREPSVHQPPHLCPTSSNRGESRANPIKPADRDEFWRAAQSKRDQQRRSHGDTARSQSGDGRVPDRDGECPQEAGRGALHGRAGDTGASLPSQGSGSRDAESHGSHGTTHLRAGGSHDATSGLRSERSRSPPGRPGVVLLAEKDLAEDRGVMEDVGNAQDLSDGSLCEREGTSREQSRVQLGCFEWQRSDAVWETLPQATESARGESSDSGRDLQEFFTSCVQESVQVFEVSIDVQARDVHKVQHQGQARWVLNEKPKKRAEVQFLSLNDEDKMDFLRAMKSELGSYLEHEAVEIARKHGVPEERILGMRWVLTWKSVCDDHGTETNRKPKARLIIKGFQDPDLLKLRRDSPTLSTQNRNMILALASSKRWHGFVGDIKTAFLNGNKTEADREIFAEPPEEVRQMLGMRPHEIFRIMKAVYGRLHAPRAWADKLGEELQKLGWLQSKLEPCVWRLFDSSGVLCGLIGVHVDDLLCTGTGCYFEEQVRNVRAVFPFGAWHDLMEEATMFCGCELRQRGDFSIELNQERYADGIAEISCPVKGRKMELKQPRSLKRDS